MTDFWIPVWLSLKTALLATVLATLAAVPTAWCLRHRREMGATVLDCLLILPMVLPPTVLGFILLTFFGRNGFLGKSLYALGISPVFSWWGTVIAAGIVSFPLVYRSARGAFEQLDVTLIRAARTLGAGELRILRTVVLPLSWPGLLGGLILGFSRALGEFGATLMIAGNIPGRTQTLPLAIYFAAEAGQMERAVQWVWVMILMSLLFLLLMNFKAPSYTDREPGRGREL